MHTKIIILISFLIFTFTVEAKLKVVASTEDVASIVAEIGGDKINLEFDIIGKYVAKLMMK